MHPRKTKDPRNVCVCMSMCVCSVCVYVCMSKCMCVCPSVCVCVVWAWGDDVVLLAMILGDLFCIYKLYKFVERLVMCLGTMANCSGTSSPYAENPTTYRLIHSWKLILKAARQNILARHSSDNSDNNRAERTCRMNIYLGKWSYFTNLYLFWPWFQGSVALIPSQWFWEPWIKQY